MLDIITHNSIKDIKKLLKNQKLLEEFRYLKKQKGNWLIGIDLSQDNNEYSCITYFECAYSITPVLIKYKVFKGNYDN